MSVMNHLSTELISEQPHSRQASQILSDPAYSLHFKLQLLLAGRGVPRCMLNRYNSHFSLYVIRLLVNSDIIMKLCNNHA